MPLISDTKGASKPHKQAISIALSKAGKSKGKAYSKDALQAAMEMKGLKTNG